MTIVWLAVLASPYARPIRFRKVTSTTSTPIPALIAVRALKCAPAVPSTPENNPSKQQNRIHAAEAYATKRMDSFFCKLMHPRPRP